MSTQFKFRLKRSAPGAAIHSAAVFIAPGVDRTYQHAGVLLVSEEEWSDLASLIENAENVQIVEEQWEK